MVSKQKEEYENFREIMEIVQMKRINMIVVKRGDKLVFDNSSYIHIFYPTEPLVHDDINNNSIVAKFMCNETSILFTGDIEKEAEEKLLNICGKDELKADVLKVPHHGSKTSMTDKLLEEVSPKIALIGVRRRQ